MSGSATVVGSCKRQGTKGVQRNNKSKWKSARNNGIKWKQIKLNKSLISFFYSLILAAPLPHCCHCCKWRLFGKITRQGTLKEESEEQEEQNKSKRGEPERKGRDEGLKKETLSSSSASSSSSLLVLPCSRQLETCGDKNPNNFFPFSPLKEDVKQN